MGTKPANPCECPAHAEAWRVHGGCCRSALSCCPVHFLNIYFKIVVDILFGVLHVFLDSLPCLTTYMPSGLFVVLSLKNKFSNHLDTTINRVNGSVSAMDIPFFS